MDKTLDWNLYLKKAREVAAEGCVLLENRNQVLPLAKGMKVSLFGRIQEHYYKSGTGSGGMVNVSHTWSIPEGIRESSLELNEDLAAVYAEWAKEHPIDEGEGWGNEPWSQEEMPLTDELVTDAAGVSDAAVVVIGRTAGEDKDATDTPGSYRLTDTELDMLGKVRKGFDKMIVLLNVGSILDMSFMDSTTPDAVLYLWQGGMIGGLAVADVLTGVTAPSGHLTDTIAYKIEDYPSDANFGNADRDYYAEDIYVGYRYFNTFAKDKIRYPFGYGLTYTDFELAIVKTEVSDDRIFLQVAVSNTGKRPGKQAVQIYLSAPQGKLGRPAIEMVAFDKTGLVEPGAKEILSFLLLPEDFATYDDSGITGFRNAYVLEAGNYRLLAGFDSLKLTEADKAYTVEATRAVRTCEECLAPVLSYQRMRPEGIGDTYTIAYEETPTALTDMDDKRRDNLPTEIPQTGDLGYRLEDVLEGKVSMSAFIGQLSDEDLSCIVRGEGMGSSLVTPGTASAFGGVSPRLKDYGIPSCCCDDGPSGMRLDCGTKAFNIPNGTLLACTFNRSLIEELFEFLGLEMSANHVDALLGPGMNIHRHPLNGRNFEYFSEDPYMTGMMACAELEGLHQAGVTGTLKHFAGNNQEYCRRTMDSVISQRALREIYLKGFEIAVRCGNAKAVMTTYGSLNGLWTAGSYDLCTSILRKEWGYTGIVMTDWWASINERGKASDGTNFAAMVRAQNDLYMVCPDGARNATGDNTLEALQEGRLTRGELQRSAANTCRFAMESLAMKRMLGTADTIKIVNRQNDEEEIDLTNVSYITLTDSYREDLSGRDTKKGTNILIPLDVQRLGMYHLKISASSKLGELAQIPCTLFYTGIPMAVLTFNGTGGKTVTMDRLMPFPNRFALLRLYVGGNGLTLKSIELTYEREIRPGEMPW